MKCPRCFKEDTILINGSNPHYLCNNPNCVDDAGAQTQFMVVPDKTILFPYNQIFIDRSVEEFYRKPYLIIDNEGNKSL